MKTTEPIRNKQQIRKLAGYFLLRGQIRNYVLFIIGLHTLLRVSDLLCLKCDDVYDFASGSVSVRKRITLTEKKTKKTKTIKLHAEIVKALQLYANQAKEGAFLFENKQTQKAISRIQAYRIIRAATDWLGITESTGCHGLRKTLGYHTLKDNPDNPKILATIIQMYNHSSVAITLRYLGITQDDVDDTYCTARLIC